MCFGEWYAFVHSSEMDDEVDIGLVELGENNKMLLSIKTCTNQISMDAIIIVYYGA